MKLPTREEPALTVGEVCKALGLGRKIIDNAINSGRLKAYCVSRGKRKRKFIVLPEDLRAFLKSCQYTPSGRSLGQIEKTGALGGDLITSTSMN